MGSKYRYRKPNRPEPPENTIAVANRLLVEAYNMGRVEISARLLADLIKLAEANTRPKEAQDE